MHTAAVFYTQTWQETCTVGAKGSSYLRYFEQGLTYLKQSADLYLYT